MFQPIRIIARTLLIPATLAAMALASQPAAPAGALPSAHWFAHGNSAVAAGAPTGIPGHYQVKWSHWV